MNLKINHLAKKFQDDGFVIVKNFLEKSAVDELEREINRYILKILPTVPKIHVVYESGWSGPLKQFSRMELYDRYFKKILNRPATLKLLEACLGEPAEPLTTEVFYKPARVGSPALFHQENAYFNYMSPYGLVLWIALDKTTLKNGAVHFIKGSHKLGELSHIRTNLPLFSKALPGPPDPLKYPEVPALLERGDASIHHFLTIHRSGPNKTPLNRRGFVLDYRARSAQINQTETETHEEYKKEIQRNSGAL